MAIFNQDEPREWKTICPVCETKYLYAYRGPWGLVCETECYITQPLIPGKVRRPNLVEYIPNLTKTMTLISFSYKYGVPAGVPKNNVFDVRHSVRNPWRDPVLRKLDGLHPDVQKFVAKCNGAKKIINKPFYSDIVAIGCMGGKHRSVAIVELLAEKFRADKYKDKGWTVEVFHRDLNKPREKKGAKDATG